MSMGVYCSLIFSRCWSCVQLSWGYGISLSPPPPLALPLLPPSTACTESGRVFVFGRNKYGELGLGHGSSQSVAVPTPIHSLSGIVKVACGLYHSAAIDGELTHYV